MTSKRNISFFLRVLVIILVVGLLALGLYTCFTQFNSKAAQEYMIIHEKDSKYTYYEWDDSGARRGLIPIHDPDSGFLDGFENSSAFALQKQDSGGGQIEVYRIGLSCELKQWINDPLLSVSSRSDTSFIVFLDGDILYTDFIEQAASLDDIPPPKLKDAIHDQDGNIQSRTLIISLPVDYVGKTLTIVQYMSAENLDLWDLITPIIINPQTETIWYVSRLGPQILSAGLVLAMLIVLLILFGFQLLTGKKAVQLLLPIAFAFLQINALIIFDFSERSKIIDLCFAFSTYLSGDLLLCFIALKLKERLRFALLGAAALHFAVIFAQLMRMFFEGEFFIYDNRFWGIFSMCCFVLAALLTARASKDKSGRFFRFAGIAALCYLVGLAALTIALRYIDYIMYIDYEAVFSSLTSLHFYPMLGHLSVAALIFAVVYSVSEYLVSMQERRARLAAMEQLNKMKTDFLASVAHEIKTPLTVLMGSARDALDLLEEHPINIEEIADDQRLIEQTVKRIDAIVMDLMDTAAIENGRLSLKRRPVLLPDLMRNICDSYFSRTNCRGNNLVYDIQQGLPEIWADSARIEQVMINLLSNAVKHTKDGTITVSLRGKDGIQTASVADTGEGMGVAMRRMAFKQYASSGEEQWRHGIGLYLCHQIIDAHKGEIWIESEKGRGTCVSFALSQGDGEMDYE